MRKYILTTLLLLLTATLAWGEPAPGDVKRESVGGSYTTLTITGLVVGGDDRGLVVGLADEGDVAVTVTSVTWNGGAENLSQIRAQVAAGNRRVEIWYLAAPTATTANVVITLSATQTNGTLLGTAAALTGVLNDTPTLKNGAACGGCSVGQAALTSTEDNTLFFTTIQSTSHLHTYTHGAGQTETSDFALGTGAGNSSATSYELKAIAGAETLSSTCAPSCTATNLVFAVIGIEPSEPPPPPPASTRRRQPGHTFR